MATGRQSSKDLERGRQRYRRNQPPAEQSGPEPPIVSGSVLWPDREAGPWRIEASWAPAAGEPVAYRLTLEHVDGAEAVTGSLLRRLPVAWLLQQAAEAAAASAMREVESMADDPVFAEGYDVLDDAAFDAYRKAEKTERSAHDRAHLAGQLQPEKSPRGRPALATDRLEEVARVYREAAAERRPVTDAVAEHFGVPIGTASRWIYLARNRGGLLPETRKGSARAVAAPAPVSESTRTRKGKR